MQRKVGGGGKSSHSGLGLTIDGTNDSPAPIRRGGPFFVWNRASPCLLNHRSPPHPLGLPSVEPPRPSPDAPSAGEGFSF